MKRINLRQHSTEKNKSLWLSQTLQNKMTEERFLKLYIQVTTGNGVAQVKKIKTINFHIAL